MNFYRDSRIKIDDKHIHIRGVLIPGISTISLELKEVDRIKKVPLGTIEKFNILGTTNFATWWCFDFFRPFRKYGIILELKSSIGPFHAIGFTPEAFNEAYKVLTENYKVIAQSLEPSTNPPKTEAHPKNGINDAHDDVLNHPGEPPEESALKH